MKQGRLDEAKSILQSVTLAHHDSRWASESHLKSFERAQEMLDELEKGYHDNKQSSLFTIPGCDTTEPDSTLWKPQPAIPRQPRRPQLMAGLDPCMTGALLATSGFGPDRSPQHEQFQSQWWLQGGLEDEDSVDYSSPDESSDGSDGSTTGSDVRDVAKSLEFLQPFAVEDPSSTASGNDHQSLPFDLANNKQWQVKDERQPLVSAGMWTTPFRSPLSGNVSGSCCIPLEYH